MKMDTESVTLEPTVKLQLQAHALLNKAKLEKAKSAGFGAIGAWGKMLMVFKAMMGGNAVLRKEGKDLRLFNMLRGIVYNTIKDCTSLDELQQYFESIGQQSGVTLETAGKGLKGSTPSAIQENMFAKTPGYAAFVDQMSSMIGETIAKSPKHDKGAYKQAEFSFYESMLKTDDTRAKQSSEALKTQEKDLETEQTNMVNSMKSLTSMGPLNKN